MKQTTPLLPEFKTCPAVFAIKNDYQIMVPVNSDLLFWVTVGDKKYYDHSNGIIRSSTRMHRVNVPMSELDKAGEYTVSYRKIIDRKPYFPETEDEVSATYKFKPVNTDGKINIYHLSDTHGKFNLTSDAGTYFGEELDLLVLNGDVPDHSGKIENFDLIYKLCEHITQGSRPCVFSRGNHDTRGFYAENIAEYTPTENGHSYFTFRCGKLWGIVFDCGEDKPDTNAEYGHTVCCHEFRLDETKYVEDVIKNAKDEYLAEGVEHRIAIAHHPFSYIIPHPFDIEQDIYGYWCKLLKEEIKPQVFLSGHLHQTRVAHVGGALDNLGQPCTVIVGSKEIVEDKVCKNFIGCAVTIDGENITASFTDSEHNVIESETFKA